MTSHEILKADVLDILFEHRNKSYGAYALRREYDKRLLLAVALSISSFFLIYLLIPGVKKTNGPIICNFPVLEISKVDDRNLQPPPTPPSPRLKVKSHEAQESFVNKIKLVSDLVKTDVPDINKLTNANIGTVPIAGDVPAGIPTPSDPGPTATAHTSTTAEDRTVTTIERQPEFPGGIKALAEFLARNLVAPGELDPGEKKTVLVRFIVNEDGTVTQFELIRSAGTQYDKEVMRVLKKMPRWIPAIQNGRNVTVSFMQPVTFQTVEE